MNRVYNVVKNGPDYPRFAINEGVRAAGDHIESTVHAANIVITWNNYGTAKRLGEIVKGNGGKQIVFENGYLAREQHYYAAGINGYAALDEREINKIDRTRFDKLGLTIEDWKKPGEYVLVCAQRGGGYSPLAMNNNWPNYIIKALREFTDRPIVYKPHPGRSKVPTKTSGKVDVSNRPLQELLKNAFCVVTHTSNAANDALLAGVPVIVTSGLSTAASLARDISHVENPYYPSMDERRDHFDNLANRQWHREEISRGEAWRSLVN